MACICHEQPCQFRHSFLRKQWCEVDPVKILGTITFPAKLFNNQLAILILLVVPKDRTFIGVKYTIVEILST